MRQIKAGDQMTIGEYFDGVVNGSIEWARGLGICIVGRETIYSDFWQTGPYYYMTNDKKLDSTELPAFKAITPIEFVELGELKHD